MPATRGLRVSGRGIRLVAAVPGAATINTGAGYGLLFDGCDGCSLEGVVVTGGERDEDGRATDAAIVVRESTVVIRGS